MESTIKLDQFLKLAAVVRSGGEAKYLIQTGQVSVNGKIETRRGRKLRAGDVVSVEDEVFEVDVMDEALDEYEDFEDRNKRSERREHRERSE